MQQHCIYWIQTFIHLFQTVNTIIYNKYKYKDLFTSRMSTISATSRFYSKKIRSIAFNGNIAQLCTVAKWRYNSVKAGTWLHGFTFDLFKKHSVAKWTPATFLYENVIINTGCSDLKRLYNLYVFITH